MRIKFSRKKDMEESKDLTIVITECPACSRESGGEVCMHCGETLYPKRITFLRIIRDIPDVFFDVEQGLFYTIRTFLYHPGRQIKRYFAGDRSRHYKPLKFILFVGGFTTFIYVKCPITDGKPESAVDAFGTQWNSLLLLLQMPLIAFITWLVFKKRKYTYGEHLIANSYLIAEVSVFNILIFPIQYFVNGTPYVAICYLLYLIFILWYYSFAFYDWFYDRKGSDGLMKSIFLTLGIFFIVMFFTVIMQSLLYVLFVKLGWA